jgi:cation diffusion facilitator CzcD-associated flavoprotein CzcO
MSNPSIAIIGCGFGGLGAAIELKKAGYDDIVIFEKGAEVGGVWRENTYPGAACDVPSPFYSYSFEPNPRWPRRFSQQPAILEYLKDVTDKYDLRRHIRFGTEVTAASYDEETRKWTVTLSSGDGVVVDLLVSAVGQLSRPAMPNIKGVEEFEGAAFHSATWDHSVDLTGKRVAVIGTGASSIQFVPELQPKVASLELFQRTPPYIIPRPDTEFGPAHHKVFERLPVTQLVERGTWYGVVESLSIAWVYSKPLARIVRQVSKAHMKRQTRSVPGLFEKVWPSYPIGCKRILFSSDYLPALAKPNVEVITDGIKEITAKGVVTENGVLHEVDAIVYGTGFAANEFLAPMSIKGIGGRDLHEEWAEGARAYYGIAVPNFPNLFIMYGPNTNTGGGSIIYFLEVQARYLRKYVDHMVASKAPLMVKQAVEDAFDNEIQSKLNGSVWTSCSSWYRNASGRVTTNWPLLGIEYRQKAKFDPEDFELVKR